MPPSKTTWVRHRILLSRDDQSIAVGDFLFFADGTFAVSNSRAFPRGAAIDLKTDMYGINRRKDSDIVSIKVFSSEQLFFEYHHSVFDQWWQVVPTVEPLPGEEPTPLRRKSE